MSQEKVDRYKEEKRNREKIMKKENGIFLSLYRMNESDLQLLACGL